MMSSEEDEPVEYIYKRRRPEKSRTRKYKKIIVEESDPEQERYIYPQNYGYQKKKMIRYDDIDEFSKERRRYFRHPSERVNEDEQSEIGNESGEILLKKVRKHKQFLE